MKQKVKHFCIFYKKTLAKYALDILTERDVKFRFLNRLANAHAPDACRKSHLYTNTMANNACFFLS